jgi:hypothetical protein
MKTWKGQASSMYTLIGVLLVAVFALFLFVTQSGNQAENLRTLVTTDVSFNSEVQLRGLYSQSFTVPRESNMKVITALSYACEYGKKEKGYPFTISERRGLRVETLKFMESYFNETLSSNYRFEVDCEGSDRSLVVGQKLPEDADIVVSTKLEMPLAKGNRTEAFLQRW